VNGTSRVVSIVIVKSQVQLNVDLSDVAFP
jgi:hypothetical protein